MDQYNFIIKYIKGSANVLADAMSRVPRKQPLMNIEREERDEVISVILSLMKEGRINENAERKKLLESVCEDFMGKKRGVDN